MPLSQRELSDGAKRPVGPSREQFLAPGPDFSANSQSYRSQRVARTLDVVGLAQKGAANPKPTSQQLRLFRISWKMEKVAGQDKR